MCDRQTAGCSVTCVILQFRAYDLWPLAGVLEYGYEYSDTAHWETGVLRNQIKLVKICFRYQGNNGRLVVTPLTDRCVLTLLTAKFLNRGGNPLGPAGSSTFLISNSRLSTSHRHGENRNGQGSQQEPCYAAYLSFDLRPCTVDNRMNHRGCRRRYCVVINCAFCTRLIPCAMGLIWTSRQRRFRWYGL